MLGDLALQRVEHVLCGDLAQPREVAAVVCFLQAQEVAPGFLEKALDVEAGRNIGDELAAVIRLHSRVPRKLRRRWRSHGLVTETGVLYQRSLRSPHRQQTHQSEHDGAGKQGHEKRADRGSEASLREQPAQAKARGESSKGRKPPARPGRLRRRRRLLLLRRGSRLLRRSDDLALGSETSAATEPRRLDVICQDAGTEYQREQGNDQIFHSLSPRLKICNPDAKPRRPRSG